MATLALPETTGSLQEEIDGELLLLSEGIISSDADFSSPTRSEQHTSGLASARNGFGAPSTAPAGSIGSDGHEEGPSRGKLADYNSQSSSQMQDEAQNQDNSPRALDWSSFDGSPAAPSSPYASSSTTVFDANLSDESDSSSLSRLFAQPELPEVVERSSCLAELNETGVSTTGVDGFVCLAQSSSEIEAVRRHRSRFAKSLEVALAEQKAEFESCFEERYESSAQLHGIEMLNLQDDHEAVFKELKHTTKDLRARLVDRTKALRTSRAESRSLRKQCSTIEELLQERSTQRDQLLQAVQGRETLLQEKNEEVHGLRDELARTRQAHQLFLNASLVEDAELERSRTDLEDRYRGLLPGLNLLNVERQNSEAQLEATRRQLETARAALQAQQEACEKIRARHDHVVAEKVRDVSWHVAHNSNPLAMKPMNTEYEIREATKQLRERLEEEIATSADLGRQREAAQAANKAKFKNFKRVMANQSQEKVILEMALAIAQGQRDHWAEQYDEIADAVASKITFSSFTRGLAERHLALQETRFALEAELLEAKLRGDRAVLDREIRKRHEVIKLGKRDAEIATLKHELQTMKQNFDNENGLVRLYKEIIDKEMPELQSRNSEVERMLEEQLRNNIGANHQSALDDLVDRLHKLEKTNRYWEREVDGYLQEFGYLQTHWNMFTCSVFFDLTNARTWRNDRDRLELENVALGERFADELMNEPLVIPEDRKTRQDIEDDFKLESIDDCLLKQFKFTWGAVPKVILGSQVPPWEHILAGLQGDIAAVNRQWMARRDALMASFEDGLVDMPSDHEWVGSGTELDAIWKREGQGNGKAKATGEG